MALVRNIAGHGLALTVGYLATGEERNIDVSGAWEQQLVSDGKLVVLDGSSPPPPAEPLAQTARQVFVSSTQPNPLPRGAVWFDTSDSNNVKVWVND